MSGKHYGAVNTKYYKHSNSNGEIGHVLRSFLKNKNAFEELTKNNFGFVFGENNLNIEQQYILKLEEAKRDNKKVFQKNSTTYIDSVIILDSKKFFECEKKDIEEATKAYMLEFKEKYGYEPIGFEFHLDEGTKIKKDDFEKLSNEEKSYFVKFNNSDDEYIKNNIHAHAIFLNYDFDKKKTCHRNMKIKDWENTQDLLHKHFKHLGFDRGISKKLTKAEHTEKEDYLKKLQLEIEKNENLSNDLNELKTEYSELLDDVILVGLEKELTDEKLDNFDKVKDLTQNALKTLFNSKAFLKTAEYIEKNQPNLFKFLKKKGTEVLEMLDIKKTDFLPEQKQKQEQKQEVEQEQPEPQPEVAKVQEQEEPTLMEQMELDKPKLEEKLKKMNVEDKKAEHKKIKDRRRHGKKSKNN